jgi:O-acetyl-ADP-ribose deacetylase (regulator of RNase III)
MNKIEIKKCNAIDYVLDHHRTALIHVCNDVGHMNSGIAKEIRERIPSTYSDYKSVFILKNTYNPLGQVAYSDKKVFSMICQHGYYGQNGVYEDKKYINYGALADCLIQVAEIADNNDINTIVLPMNMGSDRAGGEWYDVLEMVKYFLANRFDLVICEYGEQK